MIVLRKEKQNMKHGAGGTLARKSERRGEKWEGKREEREGGREKEIDLKGGKISNKIAFLIKR